MRAGDAHDKGKLAGGLTAAAVLGEAFWSDLLGSRLKLRRETLGLGAHALDGMILCRRGDCPVFGRADHQPVLSI